VIADYPFKTLEGKSMAATISIGVATLLHDGDENDLAVLANDLVDRADQAVYTAKNQGRDQVVLAAG
jgi:PleD family two-component response regulator